MAIAVTGGAGYIGSHTIKKMVQHGMIPVVYDNLSRGHIEAIPNFVAFEHIDLMDQKSLRESFIKYKIDGIIHFAAFAYVGESTLNPEMYFYNNTVGSLNLLKTMRQLEINKIVFSSTCSIYGNPLDIPIIEDSVVRPINPYAISKHMVEQLIKEYESAYGIRYVILRYFNAAGASFEGEVGESHDPEPHLIPIVLSVASGQRESVIVYGADYLTKDGSCIRDYVHVDDLADAHIRALNYLQTGKDSTILNLGTGIGNSVFEVIKESELVTGRRISFSLGARRVGDPDILVADNQKAKMVLGWEPRYELKDIIESAWKWHNNKLY